MDCYFDILVSADDVEHHKPAPDTFLKCAELMGVEPARCQVFEDGEQGLEAARRAGMIPTDVRPYLD
jgi:HAD superfamily hydrolase (TIGR01509 family)